MNLNIFNKDSKETEKQEPFMYTEDQLMARLRFFIGVCLALTLTGIVFVVLYSIIFVTQPLNAISPIDQKFFEMLVPISTFLTGILSGIMLADKGDKEAKMKAIEAATRPVTPPPPTGPMSPIGGPSPFTPRPPMMPGPVMSPPTMPSQGMGMGAPATPSGIRGPLPTPPGALTQQPPPPPVGAGRPPLPPGV